MQTSRSSRPGKLYSGENWFRAFTQVGVAVLLILSTAALLHAQGVAISTTNAPADNSAILDAMSSTAPYKGVLIPRMTQAQRNGIVAPANGLLVYMTDVSPGIYYYDRAYNAPIGRWQKLIPSHQLLANADNTNIALGSTDPTQEILRLNLSNGSSTADALHVNHEGQGNGVRVECINQQSIAALSGSSAGQYGVYGQGGATGTGVFGEAGSWGVFGQGETGVEGFSPTGGSGVTGSSDGNFGYGVVGIVGGSSAKGVYGAANINGGDGVFGSSTFGTGVKGQTSSGSDGVNGQSFGFGGNGVVGIANNGSSAYGVWGRSTSGYGVVCSGKFSQSGGAFEASPTSTTWTTNKPATVKLSDGSKVKLFAEEAAEIYFNDYGEGRLSNGRAHIELDSKFLQTLTIDQAHPMKVFVQVVDECNGMLVANRNSSGFDVVEMHNGKSNASFMYRVVCKRKYYEDERLATEEQDTQYNKRMLETVWPEVIAEQKVQEEKAKQMDERQRKERESMKAIEERFGRQLDQKKSSHPTK